MRWPAFLDSLILPKKGVERAPASLSVEHAGTVYRVAVKRVATARRLTLRVRTATRDAVLTMPPRASLRLARSFAERHAEWIGVRLRALPDRIALAPGTIVPFRGVDHRIVHEAPPRSLKRVVAAGHDADDPPCLVVSGPPDEVGRHLVDFFKREAHRDLAACVARHTLTLARPCRRIAIRDTRSRWGSCSSKGNLNFSWRLVLAPPFVLDYLAAHECAHLCHLDHSDAFWALTLRLAPRTAAAEAWLKTHGGRLHLYGA